MIGSTPWLHSATTGVAGSGLRSMIAFADAVRTAQQLGEGDALLAVVDREVVGPLTGDLVQRGRQLAGAVGEERVALPRRELRRRWRVGHAQNVTGQLDLRAT